MVTFNKPVREMHHRDVIVSRGLRGKISQESIKEMEFSRRLEKVVVKTKQGGNYVYDLGGYFETVQ